MFSNPTKASPGTTNPLDQLVLSLLDLSMDRVQTPIELHFPNDYYGHAAALKDYVGFHSESLLPVSVVHGLRFDGGFWEHDFAPLHTMGFVASPWHAAGLHGKVYHDLRAIGPLVHYAKGIWNADKLASIREVFGRILLVYPVHSTHWIDTNYDVEAFCSQVDTAAAGFDSVVVCMYWKDVLRGVHRRYQERGFHCVTNGHMYDFLFLQRQRSLLEACSGMLTNGIGTHLGYAVHLGKPVQVLPSQVSKVEHRPGAANRSASADAISREIGHAFSTAPVTLSDSQKALAGKYWGFDSTLSPTDMKHLLDEAQTQRKRAFFCIAFREEWAKCTRIARTRLTGIKARATYWK